MIERELLGNTKATLGAREFETVWTGKMGRSVLKHSKRFGRERRANRDSRKKSRLASLKSKNKVQSWRYACILVI